MKIKTINEKLPKFLCVLSVMIMPFTVTAEEPNNGGEGAGAKTVVEDSIALCKQHLEEYPEPSLKMLNGRTCEEFFTGKKDAG